MNAVVVETEGRRRVLVVDDHDGMRVLLAVMLQRRGYEPVTVASAKEALAELEAGPYDAVLSDEQMPGENGLELLRHLRARGDWTPFVLMSAVMPAELIRSALASGATVAVDKSSVVEALGTVLERALSAPWRRSAESPSRRSRTRPSPSLAR
jgi:two-component system response regulator (stage 0 sporulation protein F)